MGWEGRKKGRPYSTSRTIAHLCSKLPSPTRYIPYAQMAVTPPRMASPPGPRNGRFRLYRMASKPPAGGMSLRETHEQWRPRTGKLWRIRTACTEWTLHREKNTMLRVRPENITLAGERRTRGLQNSKESPWSSRVSEGTSGWRHVFSAEPNAERYAAEWRSPGLARLVGSVDDGRRR
jgi:hypothetical protein